MSSIKRQYQTFIDEMIQHGDQTRAYQAAYPKASKESARVKSYDLLQNVTIANAIEKGRKEKQQGRENLRKREDIQKAEAEILSQVEVDAALCQVITSKFSLVRDGQTKRVVKVENTTSDRLKAIDMYYKRFGGYAPTKAEVTGKDGDPINLLPPTINVYNTAPPMASSEDEIEDK